MNLEELQAAVGATAGMFLCLAFLLGFFGGFHMQRWLIVSAALSALLAFIGAIIAIWLPVMM